MAWAEVCINGATNQLTAVRGLRCPSPNWLPFRGIGANLFDVLWDAERQRSYVSRADTIHAMETFAAAGLRYFRCFGKLFGHYQNRWLSNPTQFWAGFDFVVNEAAERGLYIILSLELGSFDALVDDEGFNAIIQDRSSRARTLAQLYVQEVIVRYNNRSTILFWELTNELNLPTAIPPPREVCDPHKRDRCFGTESLATFTADMVLEIRRIDKVRPISSGFAAPRPSAWNLEHRGSWRRDSREQWMNMLKWQNREVDIMSIHLYGGRECYFDGGCTRNEHVVEAAAEAAASEGKQLFLGEYGPISDYKYMSAVLQLQVDAARAPAESPLRAFMLSTVVE